MRLVERDSELADLTRLLTDCSQKGANKVALISGVTAIGKTALLLNFAERVTKSGALFLGAAASHSEQSLQLGVLDQLFRNADLSPALAEHAERLLDAARDATSVRPTEPASSGDSAAPLLNGAWLTLLWKLLRELSVERPVVISVDNVQCIDQCSLHCLLYLLRRLKSAPIFTVLTRDISQRSTDSLLDAELLSDPDFLHIRLDLLSPQGVKAIMADQLGAATAEDLAPTFYQATGGNPLLVNALVSDYRTHAKSSANFVAGDSFAAAVASCLYRSGPLISEVARIVAVSGESFPPLLDELISPAASSGHPLHVLEAMGLMQGVRFRHEAVRTAVLNEMTPRARAAIHHQIADLLQERGAQPDAIAPHIVAADRHDEPWMPRTLREAADRAMSSQDLDTAIRYLRLAHRSFPNDRQRAATTSLLACAEWQVTPGAAIRHLPELTAASQAGDLNGADSGRLIRYLLWFGKTDEAASLTAWSAKARSPDAADPVLPESLRSWLLLFSPDLLIRIQGDHVPAPDAGRLIAAAQNALESSRLDDSSLAQIIEALNILLCLDQHETVASCCESLLKEAGAKSTRTWYALLSAFYSLIDLRRGNIIAARERADHALALIPLKGWGVSIGIPLSALLLATVMQGDYQEASKYLNIPVSPSMFQTTFALHYLYARGRYRLITNDSHAALGDFQKCREMMSRWDLDLPCLVPWRAGAAEACLRLNRRQQARELTDEQLSLARPGHQRTRGITLRIRAAFSEAKTRSVILQEAIELLDEVGDRAELALTFADLARAHYALGERRQARAMERRATRLANQCGIALTPPAAQDLTEPWPDAHSEETSQRPAVELSNAELRVASLAARGYSNREIADNLYITVSTVEQHLTRIYRKLHVNRRIDLPVGLSGRRQSGSMSPQRMNISTPLDRGPMMVLGKASRRISAMRDNEPNVILCGGHSSLSLVERIRYVHDTDEKVKLLRENHYEHFAPTMDIQRHLGRDLQVFMWVGCTGVAE
jgi:DNA-binding CsgD family transcriptional regulator